MTTSHTYAEAHPELENHDVQEADMRRPLILLSLGLSLLLVAGVLVGSKLYLKQLNNQPVALAELPSPDADSAECAALIGNLPDKVAGHKRAELADPAPHGAAVWQSSSAQRVTLRCGVDAPLQYTELTPTHEAGGAHWMKVVDPAPGSNLTTWFTVDRSPVVAVTADDAAMNDDAADAPAADLDLSALKETALEPNSVPLAELAAATHTAETDGVCNGLMDALPAELAGGFRRVDVDGVEGLGRNAAAWTADGFDPIVLKCGVEPPAGYEPGARLTQINEVPWFEDTTGDNVTQATTLYALGRATGIAVSVPAGAADGALTTLSDLIARNVPEQ